MSDRGNLQTKNIVTELDREILQNNYEFIPSERGRQEKSWEDRMVERYNTGLYREFALADLSRPGQLGLRWRTRQEVLNGRGERSCGNKRCLGTEGLQTLEVPFAYQEKGINKKELVKLKLCQKCKSLVVKPKDTESEIEQKSRGAEDRRSRNENEKNAMSTCSDSSESSYTRKKKRRKRRKKSRERKRLKKGAKDHILP